MVSDEKSNLRVLLSEYKEGDFQVTKKGSERTIALPFFNNLMKEEIYYVCENLKEIIAGLY